MGIAVRRRPGGWGGRGALVLLALFGLGCPGPGREPERVVRLPLADAGTPTPVEAEQATVES